MKNPTAEAVGFFSFIERYVFSGPIKKITGPETQNTDR